MVIESCFSSYKVFGGFILFYLRYGMFLGTLSGLANRKTLTIQAGGKDLSILIATTKTKKQNKPASLLHKSITRKEFPRMVKTVTNQVTLHFIF